MSTEEREKASILLVDDQPSRLTTYEAILGDLGHELVRASSGRQALEHIQRTQFAVIVLDVNMPVLDGFETAALIQRHPSSEPTPIIFVTGLRIADFDRLRGYELGAVDYVYVPVVPEILRAKVAVFVELSTNRRRLRTLIERLEAANAELALANSALECETARELKEKNEALERANAELTRTNSDLAAEVVERARLAADLNEADRRKDEFLSILAHELRNPLAPIVSAVEIMRRTKIEDPELVWCREVVDRQSRNLTRLVEGLLDVSRITTGKIQIQKAEIEIAAVVERAIELARPQVDAGRHRLTVERPGHPIHVEGDLTRLAQAVGNVLGNAAKYTPEGGQIRVIVEESRRPDDTPEVAIRVRDTGVGIEPEALPYVFELFTQGERAIDRAHGALGIGLALVARLVEIHGGTVAAHSDGPGAGSEFVIRLPALPRGETGGERQPAARGRTPSHSAQRVLVVDDNADAARSLAVLLEAAGNTVEIAFDGTEAIDMADEFRPDAVLLDIGMPRLDGYGAARWIRAQPWARNVLLVAVTGWGQEDVRARTLEAGFDEHMVKPVDVASLAQLFAKLPSGHRCDLVDT